MARELEGVLFDSKKQDAFVPVEEGTYPAHISSLDTKEVMTRAGEAIIVNMSYTIADEAADLTQPLYEMDGYKHRKDVNGNKIPLVDKDGNEMHTNCTHLPGRKYYDNGFFVFTTSESANKNSRYFKLLEGLGIELEEDDGKKKLVLVEEEDVLGLPVNIKLETHSYVTKDTRDLPVDQQERKFVLKAKEVTLWKGGERLSQDEMDDDVPF